MSLQQVTARELTVSTALTSADFDEDGMLGLVIGEINRADGLADAAVGVSGSESPRVLVFQWSEGAFGNAERRTMNDEQSNNTHHSSFITHHSPEVFPLPAEATALVLAQLDEAYTIDLTVVWQPTEPVHQPGLY